MDAPAPAPAAWQPLTPGGVARFARASFARLIVAQLIVASLVGLSLCLFVRNAWLPVIESSLGRAPTNAVIRLGHLEWPASSAGVLAANNFLCIAANPAGDQVLDNTADLQLELTASRLRLSSLFGYVETPYPDGYRVSLNPAATLPWWGARRPFLFTSIFVGSIVFLWLSWVGLATLGAVPARLIAFYADRDLTLPGAWRLAAAALLPGALVFAAVIAGYTLHRVDFRDLLLAWALHFIADLAYLVVGTFQLPRLPAPGVRRKGNPFQDTPEPPPAKNPFQ